MKTNEQYQITSPEICFTGCGLSGKLAALVILLLFPFYVNAQISGPALLTCAGNTDAYSWTPIQPGVTYTWSVSGTASGVVLPGSPNGSCSIQWTGDGNAMVEVSANGGPSVQYNVTVQPVPLPFITYTNEVLCQGIEHSAMTLDDAGGCVKVCAESGFSGVEYTAHSMPGLTGSTFTWSVSGGSFSPTSQQATAGGQVVTVYWGVVGFGTLTVTEVTTAGCEASRQVCIEIIESPEAGIHVQDLIYQTSSDCYIVCFGQTVYFQDHSSFGNSPGANWSWNFNDPGNPQNIFTNNAATAYTVQHNFSSPGLYIVNLTVTNQCGCKDETWVKICVLDLPGPPIFCPSVVCENSTELYTTNAKCNPYTWGVTGSNSAPLPNQQTVAIIWDNVGPLGFGYVTLDGGNCDGTCKALTVIQVPVIQQTGTIAGQGVVAGQATACAGKQYRYWLPAWPATNFYWSIDPGTNSVNASIASWEDNGNEVTVNTGTGQGQFTLRCHYYNTLVDCSGDAEQVIKVVPQAVVIAPKKSCTHSDINCSIGQVPGVSGQTDWYLSNPGSTTSTLVQGSGGTVILPGTNFTTPGLYMVYAENPFSFCPTEPVTIQVVDPPSPPNLITGEAVICPLFPYIYTATAILPGTVFYWETFINTGSGWVPGGASPSTGWGESISTVWSAQPPGTQREIRVYRAWGDLTDCMSAPVAMEIDEVSMSGLAISPVSPASLTVCQDMVAAYQVNYPDGEVYLWELDPSSAALGSISGGQGTTQVEITWNHVNTTSGMTATLYCTVTRCGTGYTCSVQVTVQPFPVFTISANPNPVCELDPVNFTLNSSIAGTNYQSIIWSYGDNSPNTTGTQTAVSHSYSLPGNTSASLPVTATVTAACPGSGNFQQSIATETIIIDPVPDVNLTPAGNTLVCTTGTTAPVVNQVLNLSVSGTGNTIEWYHVVGGGSPALVQTGGTTFTATNTPSPGPFVNELWYAVVYAPPGNPDGCDVTSPWFGFVYDDCLPPQSCTPDPPFGWSPPNSGQFTFPGALNLCVNANKQKELVVRMDPVAAGDFPAPNSPPAAPGPGANNVVEVRWGISPLPGYVGQSGTGIWTKTNAQNGNNLSFTRNSPTYFIDKPGMYGVCYQVFYTVGGVASPPCLREYCESIPVYLIADFTMKLQCNASNTGYEIVFTDNTAYFPGHQPNWYRWAVDVPPPGTPNPVFANITSANNLSTFTYQAPGPGTYTFRMQVRHNYPNPPGGFDDCEYIQTITVPDFPQASFNVTTTDPDPGNPLNVLESCENREVIFNSNSTPAPATSLQHVWSFGDFTTSWLAPQTARTYFSPGFKTASLLITDQYGCTSSASKQVLVFDNNLGYDFYDPLNQILCAGTPASIQLMNVSGGTPTYSYAWHRETVLLTGTPSSATLSNINIAGAYWVTVSDAKGCYLDANPTPATVNFINPPPALILGSNHICLGDDLELNGITGMPPGASTVYTWVRNPGNVTVGSGTTFGTLTDPGLPVGNYTYELTISYTSGGATCYATSAPFPVEVHPLPAPPVIDPPVVTDCNIYEFMLTASPAGNYTWSNGDNNNPTYVYAGGTYRAWIIDNWGCRNHDDVTLPPAPGTFFWRFPQNACYRFCADFLPRHIDGPSHEVFDYWEWLQDGGTLPDNGPYNSQGTNSLCDPLYLYFHPHVNGSYQWTLGNQYCQQTSDPMDITVIDGCDLLTQFTVDQVQCMGNGTYKVDISGFFNGSGNYNLYLIDPATNQPLMNTVQTGTLSGGYFQLTGIVLTPNPAPAGSQLKLCIRVNEVHYGLCCACVVFEIPDCGQHRQTNAHSNSPEAGLLLAPNPATASVQIRYRFAGSEAPGRSIVITDISGREMCRLPLRENAGVLTLDMANWSRGIYVVQSFEKGKPVATKKLVLN